MMCHLQETALQTVRIAALLCCELLHECHANPPEALATAAIYLHDHALLVGKQIPGYTNVITDVISTLHDAKPMLSASVFTPDTAYPQSALHH